MRDLTFYPKVEDFRESIRAEFLPEFLDCEFYSNLIDFIVDQRSPIFYTVSDPSEHFAFSGAYHFETRRQGYENQHRLNLFYLHDFTHLLFPYHHDVYVYSEDDFLRMFWRQERLASTETEIFAYYRMAGLREKIFPDETLYYDVLVERGYDKKPDTAWMLEHRTKLTMDDSFGDTNLGDHPEILAFFRRWRKLTPRWCAERYKSMVGVRVPRHLWQRLNDHNYEQVIGGYTYEGDQESYQSNILKNLTMAYAILGWEDPPQRWRHVPDALASLEGAVFFQ